MDFSTKGMIDSTIRVYPHRIKQVVKLLDDAYFAIETDKETLLEADRPLINDPAKAKDLIHEANLLLYKILNDDEGINKFDSLLMDLESGVRKVQGMKVEYYVTPGE